MPNPIAIFVAPIRLVTLCLGALLGCALLTGAFDSAVPPPEVTEVSCVELLP